MLLPVDRRHRVDRKKWRRKDLQRCVEQVLECFGFSRVMFGRDWPVATEAADYPNWEETPE
jgi:L-fuconolactonase